MVAGLRSPERLPAPSVVLGEPCRRAFSTDTQTHRQSETRPDVSATEMAGATIVKLSQNVDFVICENVRLRGT